MKKWWALPLERKLLFVFLWICIVLPFIMMVRSPSEIPSHVFPLWINFYGGLGLWRANSKPLWQAFLACYGVSSVGIIAIYLGSVGGEILFFRLKNWLVARLKKGLTIPLKSIALILKIDPSYQKFNSFTEHRKRRFTEWLSKKSTIFILLILLIPLPFSDIIATVAMEIKKEKYGLWYLLAANLLHVYLIVFLIYRGTEFFFF